MICRALLVRAQPNLSLVDFEGNTSMINSKRKSMLLGAVLSVASVLALATPAEAHYWHHHHRHYWHHHHRAYVKIHL